MPDAAPPVYLNTSASAEAEDLVAQYFNNAQAYAEAARNIALNLIQQFQAIAVEDPNMVLTFPFNTQAIDPTIAAVAKPTSPSAVVVAPTAPVTPTIPDVVMGVINTIPTFTVPPLVLNLPVEPTPTPPPVVGAVPSIDNPTLPSIPTYTLPIVPTLETYTFPTPPALNIPNFAGVTPVDNLTVPQNTISFFESMYTDATLTALASSLLTEISTGNSDGLNPAAEALLWNRELERTLLDNADVKLRLTTEWAKAGFSLPDGVLTTMLLEVDTKFQDDRLTTSRDVAVKQYELMYDRAKFVIQQAIGLEAELMKYASQMAQRSLDAQVAVMRASIDLFNSAVAKFNADTELFKAQAYVYSEEVKANLVIVELYKAQLEGIRIITEVDKNKVALYSALLGAIQQQIDLYKTELEAANIILGIDKVKIEAFVAQVTAYKIQVDLQVAQFNMYESAIRGQLGLTQIYATQVEAYKTQVEAAKVDVDAVTEIARTEIANNKNMIDIYATQIEAFKTQVDASAVQVNALLKLFEIEVEEYKTDSTTQVAVTDARLKEFASLIQQAIAIANLNVERAKVELTAYNEAMLARAKLSESAAQVSGQLAASALAGLNASAGIADHISESLNNSNSASFSVDENFNYNYSE
jgi:hypothetical protein